MTQARNNGFEAAFAGVGAHGADDARAHKTPAGPGAKTDKVGAALDGMQAGLGVNGLCFL